MNTAEAKKFLSLAEQAGKLTTSYMLLGGSQAEREDVGRYAAQLLVCEHQVKPCGECIQCKQVTGGGHPDVIWVVPEKRYLAIDEVRAVKEGIYIKPYSGARKVYLFSIDYMREDAANSFLKILEEPPLYGVIFILGENVNNFLPTIVSRCQRLTLNFRLPVRDEEMKTAQEEFAALLKVLKERRYEDFFLAVSALVESKDREEVEQWLDHAIWLLRDGCLKGRGVPDDLLVNSGPHGTITVSDVDQVERVVDLKSRMKYNVNLRIGLESLFFQLL